jgi:hypothetical protein
MQQRHERLPAGPEYGDQRRRRQHECMPSDGSRPALGIAAGRPPQQRAAEHQVRSRLEQDERPVRERVERRFMTELRCGTRNETLVLELGVDCVGAHLTGMQSAPEGGEANVVLAATEGAGAVSGGKRSRLVEEEELREAAGLQQRPAQPVAEVEPAGDPALAVVMAADAAGLIVEATAISVDQAAPGLCDQLAERCDPVLQRHRGRL